MSDIRARLADALLAQLNMFPSLTKARNLKLGALSDHLADVLLSLPGIAVVELPEAQAAWHGGMASWPVAVSRSARPGEVEIRSSDKRIGVNGVPFQLDAASDARALAAALLAAAVAAEQATQ